MNKMATELKVGVWYTYCCWRDLCQIKDENDIEDLEGDMEDGLVHIWSTRMDALKDMYGAADRVGDDDEVVILEELIAEEAYNMKIRAEPEVHAVRSLYDLFVGYSAKRERELQRVRKEALDIIVEKLLLPVLRAKGYDTDMFDSDILWK